MMETLVGKGLREGSARKRAAILEAARELFLLDGFDRTSVDAIAAGAGVSKRTVYDYYGDKRKLLLAVVEKAVLGLSSAVERAIDENLRDVQDLEASLIAFARSITKSALGSLDYTALMRLISMESANLPELAAHPWSVNAPEDSLAERFADYARRGLLDAPNPRLAADHFVALTLSRSANSLGLTVNPNDADTKQMIVDGVGAFLRAYAP